MTAVRFVQLTCQGQPSCSRKYPPSPKAETTATALREEAVGVGWEVMRGKFGQDVCPQCRVHAIEQAARMSARRAEQASD